MTFSGLKWPPFRESKGHDKESGIYTYIYMLFLIVSLAMPKEPKIQGIRIESEQFESSTKPHCVTEISRTTFIFSPSHVDKSKNIGSTNLFLGYLASIFFKWNRCKRKTYLFQHKSISKSPHPREKKTKNEPNHFSKKARHSLPTSLLTKSISVPIRNMTSVWKISQMLGIFPIGSTYGISSYITIKNNQM